MNAAVRLGDWQALGGAALAIRERVFVREQGVPVELEQDAEDQRCLHALAELAGQTVATGRLTTDGHIGRVAVLREARGRGIGGQILEALVAEARRRGLTEALLNAQLHALPFYERHGFVAYGPVFDDAGIPHRAMRRRLD